MGDASAVGEAYDEGDSEDADAASDEAEWRPARDTFAVEGAEMIASVSVQGNEYVLVINTEVTDQTLPYHLNIVTGATFDLTDPVVAPRDVLTTLVFMSYPYVRETVASITGRSPYQVFVLPPFSRLPNPRVVFEPDSELDE